MSPKPYPVPIAPYDYRSNVVYMNQNILDFGVAPGEAFSWQMLIGLPLAMLGVVVVMCPAVLMLLGTFSGNLNFYIDLVQGSVGLLFALGFGAGFAMLALLGNAMSSRINESTNDVPIRFNRQRRQVCFLPEGAAEPVIVEWELLKVWVGEYASVTQYGVLKNYTLGFGFKNDVTDKDFSMEVPAMGLPMALGTWELIRSFMDFEINSLSDTIPPDDVDPSSEGGMEGVAFFKAKHRRLRQRFRQGEVGFIYLLGWYLYHLGTLWTLPNHLVEWEVREIERRKEDTVPDAMKQWSMPLPENEWKLPSKQFLAESNVIRQMFTRSEGLSIYDAFRVINETINEKSSDPLANRSDATS